MCMDPAGEELFTWKAKPVTSLYSRIETIFVVSDSMVGVITFADISRRQHPDARHLATIQSGKIDTKSTQADAQLTIDKLVAAGGVDMAVFREYSIEAGVDRCTCRIVMGCSREAGHIRCDTSLLREVQSGDVGPADLEETEEKVERQCNDQESFHEEAWGDVNNYGLHPVKVREARRAKMNFSRSMKV